MRVRDRAESCAGANRLQLLRVADQDYPCARPFGFDEKPAHVARGGHAGFVDDEGVSPFEFVGGSGDATAAGLAKLRLLSKVDLTADNIVSEFRKYAWPLVCRILRAGGPTLGALEHEVSIANFGIETAPIARHVIIIRSIQTVLTRAAQAVTALLAALAAATQVFPERMQPVLDWLWTTLFGGTVP